ncbi:hypothetical protein EOD39_16176 [Acipenser ruthenus]|uniref:Uncharacterized protein n=1 Tax=Acipenser ruthenus TaxID=7906 RepID=A0A444V6I8_ACIRT|nr:hypothetical protein EOD39_16176 [Acipenser ruthenus]
MADSWRNCVSHCLGSTLFQYGVSLRTTSLGQHAVPVWVANERARYGPDARETSSATYTDLERQAKEVEAG